MWSHIVKYFNDFRNIDDLQILRLFFWFWSACSGFSLLCPTNECARTLHKIELYLAFLNIIIYTRNHPIFEARCRFVVSSIWSSFWSACSGFSLLCPTNECARTLHKIELYLAFLNIIIYTRNHPIFEARCRFVVSSFWSSFWSALPGFSLLCPT